MEARTRSLILAHRGFHWNGIPENSVEAMRAANAVADGVEFDVRETGDGVLVLNHDAIAFGLPVASTDFAKLRNASEVAGTPLASLQEAIGAIDPGRFVFAEVKVPGLARRVHEALRPRFGTRFRIGSFRMADLVGAPRELRWLITLHALQAFPRRNKIRGVDFRSGAWWARHMGLESAAWVVDDPVQAKQLIRHGVQFLTTDDPVSIKQFLDT